MSALSRVRNSAYVATSFPGTLLPPSSLAPRGGKMRDPGKEVVYVIARVISSQTSITFAGDLDFVRNIIASVLNSGVSAR